jgi:hypothetical protein
MHRIRIINLGETCLKGFCGANSQDAPRLAQAIGSCRSLRVLRLTSTAITGALVEQVIRQLDVASRKPTVDVELFLRDVYSVKNALLSSTAVIKTLSVDVSLDDEKSRYLLDGLRTNSSIRQLELRDCHLTSDATCNLTQFMQASANRSGNQVRSLTVHEQIQDLVVATMLNGSAVENLELRRDYSPPTPAFFDYLVANDSNIRLQRLTLQPATFSRYNIGSLCQYLATTSTLQELNVTLLHEGEDAQSLADGLRQNGSLVRLHVRDASTESMVTMNTFCTRNICLPMLLAAQRDSNVERATKGALLLLVPRLFAVASHAPRKAPTNILLGLLSVFEFFPNADKLRKRP